MRIDVHLHDDAGDERFQTRVLNLLEALKVRLERIEQLLTKPEIVFTVKPPQDKEL